MIKKNRMNDFYIVDDAKFVSSCLSLPSKAKPRLSLLLANRGVNVYTLDIVELGFNGNPSLITRNKSYKY